MSDLTPKCKLCGERHWRMCPGPNIPDATNESMSMAIRNRETEKRGVWTKRMLDTRHKLAARLGRPRIEDKGQSFEATKPWIALGMSRTTWYRRRKDKEQGK